MLESKANFRLSEIYNANIWNDSLKNFIDANIYQTWDYSRIVNSEKKVSHIAIYKNDYLICLAQVRIRKLPFIPAGIAYVFRGPLWIRSGKSPNYDLLSEIFKLLKSEFAIKRKLLLRIRPFIFINNLQKDTINNDSSFIRCKTMTPYRSILLEIDKELTEIKSSFRRTWRQELNKAEKNNIRVVSGNDNELFDIFLFIYHQMHERKKFLERVNVERLHKLNQGLDPEFKFQIFVAYHENVPIASLIISSVGETGIAVSGGTNDLGAKFNAAYLLQWEAIKWLKLKGCIKYDLGGD